MALNILVVDDSSVMRTMIIKTLRLSGIPIGKVHEAANGAEGLEVLSRNWIDLVLVDINMPVMNGEEMIDNLRMDPENDNLSVIVVSTENSTARVKMLEDKGVLFVHKPFTPEKLSEIIIQCTGVTYER